MIKSKLLPVDFMCIGAQKSATSWLNEVLKVHPEVWLPPIKELHYFDHLFVEKNRVWTKNHVQSGARSALYWYINKIANKEKMSLDYIRYLLSIDASDVFTDDWYHRVYSRRSARGKVKGDITPEYSTIPEEGVKYILENAKPELKVIYIIRNPVDRALSQFKMNISRSNVDTSLLDKQGWIDLYNENLEVLNNRGDYKQYIPRWKKYFKDENILFLNYETIKNDPIVALSQVSDLLQIRNDMFDHATLTRKVHVTKKIDVPSFIRGKISESMSLQLEFLNGELGFKYNG